MMNTVQEVLDRLDSLDGDDREAPLKALFGLLTPVSVKTMTNFQQEFFAEHPVKPSFSAFAEAQNAVIRECVAMELSDLGRTIRTVQGLPPLSPETPLSQQE